MCELFGLSANWRTDIAGSISQFRKRGGDTADNPDGWGLAYRERDVFVLHKKPEPAAQSALLLRLGDTIHSDLVVAHVRKANPPTSTRGAGNLVCDEVSTRSGINILTFKEINDYGQYDGRYGKF